MGNTLSQVRFRSISAVVAAVGAGVIASAAPAQAACTDWAFPESRVTLDMNGEALHFNGSGKVAAGAATLDAAFGIFEGSVTGQINGPNALTVTFNSQGQIHTYNGFINGEGFASGNWTSPFTTGTFTSAAPFTCATAPAQGPTVSFRPIIGGLRVTVSDRSGTASQCTYIADNGFTRSFGLGANATVDLDIVPALPELRNWNVTVECDNGTRTDITTFF